MDLWVVIWVCHQLHLVCRFNREDIMPHKQAPMYPELQHRVTGAEDKINKNNRQTYSRGKAADLDAD